MQPPAAHAAGAGKCRSGSRSASTLDCRAQIAQHTIESSGQSTLAVPRCLRHTGAPHVRNSSACSGVRDSGDGASLASAIRSGSTARRAWFWLCRHSRSARHKLTTVAAAQSAQLGRMCCGGRHKSWWGRTLVRCGPYLLLVAHLYKRQRALHETRHVKVAGTAARLPTAALGASCSQAPTTKLEARKGRAGRTHRRYR